MNTSNNKNNIRLNKKEMFYFISHYEKITKWMIKKMPRIANLSININKKQEIIKIKINQYCSIAFLSSWNSFDLEPARLFSKANIL